MIESGPSVAAQVLSAASRVTIRSLLRVGCCSPHLRWPYGAIERLAGLAPRQGRRSTVRLRRCTAELVRGRGVSGGRAILYLHGGGFLACGPNTHGALITRLSSVSNAPVLAVNYRMIPHSLGAAIEDCLDGYEWLRRHYSPEQIVVAGDSAGGYLAMCVATHLAGLECPAALVLISPLLQLDPAGKRAHRNRHSDAMFCPEAFDALASLVRRANGGLLYEPLDDLSPGLPPTLIHVSGEELLLHDAELACRRLRGLGVPVELVVWPGQVHVFQIAAPFVPEAGRSLKQIGARIVAATTKFVEKSSVNDLTDRMRTVG